MTLDDFWEPATVRGFTTFEGDLIATGWFDNADGKPAKGVARWDGTTWWPLGEGILGNGVDVTVFEGHLVACGFFWGEPFNNIGYWNGVEWRPFGSGMNGWVQHLAVYDGSLYASGSFESAGGKSSIHIARWTSNTVSVPDFPKNTMRAPYPNPGRGPVHIPFLVPPSKGMGRRVQVEVFDARGRILRRLHEGECPPGEHVVTWDGKTARGTVVRGICWARVTLDGVADGTIQLVRRP
jgi:hypothetical protein